MIQKSLNIISSGAEGILLGATHRCTELYPVSSLGELGALLEAMPDRPPAESIRLDLIGHSTRSGHLLQLGRTTIDMFESNVDRFFRALDKEQVFARLKIASLRLLGCETAMDPSGQRTMGRLARVLHVPVFGARKPLLKSHFNAAGFDPAFKHLLVASTQLPNPPSRLQ